MMDVTQLVFGLALGVPIGMVVEYAIERWAEHASKRRE